MQQMVWAILIEDHFCAIILNLGQGLRRRCCLKIFLILALVTISSTEQNRLCNFGRGHYGNMHVKLF